MQDLPMLSAFRDVEAVAARLERAGLQRGSIKSAFAKDDYRCTDIFKFVRRSSAQAHLNPRSELTCRPFARLPFRTQTSDLFANPGMRAAFMPGLSEDQRGQVRDEALRLVRSRYPDGSATLKNVIVTWWGHKPQ